MVCDMQAPDAWIPRILPAGAGSRQCANSNGGIDEMDIEAHGIELNADFLRARRTVKWHHYDPDVLPCWVADMDFAVAPAVRDAMDQLARDLDYGYPFRGEDGAATALAEAFARRMQSRFNWHVDPAQVLPLGDLVQGSFAAVMAFSDPGDTVVLQMPSYPPFRTAIQDTGRVVQEDHMRDDGTRHVIDLDALEKATGPRAKILLFCHPHNPTGRAFTRAELEAVARFAEKHDLIIVSDEIHCDLVYSPHKHIPFASLSPQVAARTVTLSSATKGFNIAGLRCGVLHFGSPALKERFVKRIPPKLLGTPGITGIDATIAAWDHAQPWCDKVVALLQQNRDFLADAIAREFPQAVMRLPEATYLAWIDFSRLNLPQPAGTFFLEKARVGLSPGENFGEQYGAFARLNFATSPAILKDIIARMAAAVRSNASRA
jgi:cystathionine beta-lyase